ncbi:hypothetical protein K438DRAFT_1755200 [Mycena galopus ATCC 62051]|nr:hypothetical protein K438DRAFT_1755200 [Mycena galopus ATCC 62051]
MNADPGDVRQESTPLKRGRRRSHTLDAEAREPRCMRRFRVEVGRIGTYSGCPDRSGLERRGGEVLEAVEARGEVTKAGRAMAAACAEHVRDGLCRVSDGQKRTRGRGGCCLMETGEKSERRGAGDGKRPRRALQTQEALKGHRWLVVRRGARVRAGTVSSAWTSYSVAHAIARVKRLPSHRTCCRHAADCVHGQQAVLLVYYAPARSASTVWRRGDE